MNKTPNFTGVYAGLNNVSATQDGTLAITHQDTFNGGIATVSGNLVWNSPGIAQRNSNFSGQLILDATDQNAAYFYLSGLGVNNDGVLSIVGYFESFNPHPSLLIAEVSWAVKKSRTGTDHNADSTKATFDRK